VQDAAMVSCAFLYSVLLTRLAKYGIIPLYIKNDDYG